MHAKDGVVQPMEDQLQPTGRITSDLSAGNLAVVRNANLVWHILFGELLFCLADEADLGNRINSVGIKSGLRKDRVVAKRPCGSHPALLHPHRSQRWKPDHIAHREDR